MATWPRGDTRTKDTKECIGHDKQSREENESWRQELEKMLEQRMQQLTEQTEQERENNEDWKQDLEENLLIKSINQSK